MSQNLYQWDPNADEYYDLVINTGTVTYAQVVDLIVGYYLSKYSQEDPAKQDGPPDPEQLVDPAQPPEQ